MSILITGACGRLGTYVTKELYLAGMDVRATDRAYSSNIKAPLVIADLCDQTRVYELAKNCHSIVHLGNIANIHGSYSPQDVYKKNVLANANVFQAALDLRAKNIIYASSIQTFIGPDYANKQNKNPKIEYLPMDGKAKENPTNLYGLSKIAGEQMLRHYAQIHPKRCFISLRFPYLTSDNPKNKPNAHYQKQNSGMASELFSYLHVTDAAKLISAIIQNPKPGYHQLFPASKNNLQNKSPDQLINKHYQNIKLNVPDKQLQSLVNLSEIKQLFNWEPEK